MKSSPPNSNENPPAESPSDSRNNPCFGSDLQIAALNVFADDGVSYLLPYAQFLHTERLSNPALEKVPEAPPEKMLIRFVVAEVVVAGTGLKAVERMIQKCELKFVKSADRRFAASLKTYIAAVTITLTKENV
jgi:hypothetical protein